MTVETRPVLSTPTWPRGFCPTHAFEAASCSPRCMAERIEIAELQADYDRYWRSLPKEER